MIGKANEGTSAARNLGARAAPAEPAFIDVLASDDLLHPHFLREMAEHLQRHLQVGLVSCQFDIVDAEGQFRGPGERSRWAPSARGWPRIQVTR